MTEEQAKPQPGTEPAADVTVAAAVVAVDAESGIVQAATLTADAHGALMTGVVADEAGVLAEGAIGVNDQGYAIVVARFANEDAARFAYEGIVAAEQAGSLDIEGVLVAQADEDGKIHLVKMTDHKTRNGFLAGAVAGAVVGVLFPPTILAGALWAGVGGAAIGKLRNLGARNKVARDLASVLVPGSSGIIALTRLNAVDTVQKALPEAEEVRAAAVTDQAADTIKEAAAEAGSTPEV